MTWWFHNDRNQELSRLAKAFEDQVSKIPGEWLSHLSPERDGCSVCYMLCCMLIWVYNWMNYVSMEWWWDWLRTYMEMYEMYVFKAIGMSIIWNKGHVSLNPLLDSLKGKIMLNVLVMMIELLIDGNCMLENCLRMCMQ